MEEPFGIRITAALIASQSPGVDGRRQQSRLQRCSQVRDDVFNTVPFPLTEAAVVYVFADDRRGIFERSSGIFANC